MSRARRLRTPRLTAPVSGQFLVIGPRTATAPWVKELLEGHHSEGHHSDCFSLSPQEGEGMITIDQIRALIQFLSLTSQQAAARAVVVWEAHRLTGAAANAFLKTLEEPAAVQALIVLTTAHPSLLLPTIRSRCFSIRLPAIEAEKPALSWTAEDKAVLQALEKIWKSPGDLSGVAESLTKSCSVRELLYSLLKMGSLMARANASKEQRFLSEVAQALGQHLWTWIDGLYQSIRGIQQGVALNALLLLEHHFITLLLLRKQGRQALDGNRIIAHHKG